MCFLSALCVKHLMSFEDRKHTVVFSVDCKTTLCIFRLKSNVYNPHNWQVVTVAIVFSFVNLQRKLIVVFVFDLNSILWLSIVSFGENNCSNCCKENHIHAVKVNIRGRLNWLTHHQTNSGRETCQCMHLKGFTWDACIYMHWGVTFLV